MHQNPQLKKAYGTPLMAGKTLLSPAANWLYGYDPASGEEQWKLSYETLGFSNVARPVLGDNDMVFLSTCFMRPQMLGVKLGEQPEVTWRYKKAVPNSPSPIYVDGLLYFVGDSGGLVTCLEAKSGEHVWSERIASGKYWAAPLYAGGLLYFHNEDGVTTVLKAGREFEVVAENELDGQLMASAAVEGDDLILRTDKALYRIGDGK
jgi:outer membrane protein assembly factor BamB